LNGLRLLVLNLRFLFHLHFYLRREQGDQDAHCVPVWLNLSVQDDLVVQHLCVLDAQVLENSNVQGAQI
jgi:hypothetical protein